MCECLGDEEIAHVVLTVIEDLQHFGFHENEKISPEEYLAFFRETEEDEENLIEFCKSKGKASEFRKHFLKFCFSAIKKGFLVSTVVEEFKNRLIRESHKNIWSKKSPSDRQTFNSLFVFMYILYNC